MTIKSMKMKEPVRVACRWIYKKRRFFKTWRNITTWGNNVGGIGLRWLGLGSCSSGQGPVAGPSEDRNKHAVSLQWLQLSA